ncbi:MAG TPA: hypothetical protein VHY08_23555, partial [Bacillota bacterium]|nr:hypothetical protein [Bacillota bacterium]
ILALSTVLQAREGIPVVPTSQFAKPLNQAIIKGTPVSIAVRTQVPVLIPGGKKKKENQIFISWMGVNGAIGYNIYRKDVKNKPINPKPITSITDGNTIQNIIRIDSEEWPAIKQALGISDPSQFFYDPPVSIQMQGNQLSSSLQTNTGINNNSNMALNPNIPSQPIQPIQPLNQSSGVQLINTNPVVIGQNLQPVIPGQQISNRALTRWALAQLYASVAQVMGLGYLDTFDLDEGNKYEYEVRAIMNAPSGLGKHNKPLITYDEMRLTTEPVEVKCEDSRKQLPAAKEFTIYEGDQYIEILWPKDQTVLAYDIRKTDDNNVFKKLNIMPITSIYKAPTSIPAKVLDTPVLENNDPNNPYKTPDHKNIKPMSYYIDQTIMNPGDPKSNPPGKSFYSLSAHQLQDL